MTGPITADGEVRQFTPVRADETWGMSKRVNLAILMARTATNFTVRTGR